MVDPSVGLPAGVREEEVEAPPPTACGSVVRVAVSTGIGTCSALVGAVIRVVMRVNGHHVCGDAGKVRAKSKPN